VRDAKDKLNVMVSQQHRAILGYDLDHFGNKFHASVVHTRRWFV
jgi:hypothetical protein